MHAVFGQIFTYIDFPLISMKNPKNGFSKNFITNGKKFLKTVHKKDDFK